MNEWNISFSNKYKNYVLLHWYITNILSLSIEGVRDHRRDLLCRRISRKVLQKTIELDNLLCPVWNIWKLVYCFGQWLFLSSSMFRLSIFLFSAFRELTISDTAYWLTSSNLSRLIMPRAISIWSYSRDNQDLKAWTFVHLPRVELRRNIYWIYCSQLRRRWAWLRQQLPS